MLVLCLVGAPGFKYAGGELESILAEGLLFGESFCVATEVALQMRPTDLPPFGPQVLVTRPAIRDDDPAVVADQLVELLAVAVLGDLEDRCSRGAHAPQRAGIAGGPPAGLVDMQCALGRIHARSAVVRVASAALARCKIASTLPDRAGCQTAPRPTPTSPAARSRLRAVNVTIAARNLGPNADQRPRPATRQWSWPGIPGIADWWR